jgi:hypothetical protein
MRSAEEMERTTRYIENNPVSAGLVERAEDYRWSSVWKGRGLKAPLQAEASSTS